MAFPNKFPKINQELLSQLRGLFFSKDNPVMLPNNGFIGLHSIDTPATLPPFPYRFIYVKADGCVYILDYNGNEYKVFSSDAAGNLFIDGNINITGEYQINGSTALNKNWITWTPTITQGVIINKTVIFSRYIVISNICHIQAKLSITSAGTGGNIIIISGLPAIIQPINNSINSAIGNIVFVDTGTTVYQGSLVTAGANDLRGLAHNNANYIGATPLYALANNDIISFQATYEV